MIKMQRSGWLYACAERCPLSSTHFSHACSSKQEKRNKKKCLSQSNVQICRHEDITNQIFESIRTFLCKSLRLFCNSRMSCVIVLPFMQQLLILMIGASNSLLRVATAEIGCTYCSSSCGGNLAGKNLDKKARD